MKKLFVFVLTFSVLLSLAACSQPQNQQSDPASTPAADQLDMAQVYNTVINGIIMPDMLPLEQDMLLDYCGIDPADCVQAKVYICADGLRTDEIWLLEATDADALARLRAAADSRLSQKAAESETYSPEQYAVVQKARVIANGNYLAVLVSPDVDTMAVNLGWNG